MKSRTWRTTTNEPEPTECYRGVLAALTDSFRANVKADILQQPLKDVAGELEKIAEAEAARITEIIVEHYRDPIRFAEILHLRLTINDTVVKNDCT